MKRYILNIASIFASLCISTAMWGQTQVSGTWAGGALTGSYVLNGNTTLTNTITIAVNTTLTVDLNGYVLSGGNNGLVFNVGGTLNIKDSRPSISHEGYIDDNGIFRWTQNIPSGYTSTIVKGGIVYNPYKDAATDKKGIAVSGVCNIEGAKIVGCYATRFGAAVTVGSSGRLTMKNGEVRYNCSGSNQSDIGGAIYGEPSHKNQGAIINISGSVISDNKSTGAGGAICGWTVTLDGCTIERNVASYNGGGLYVRSSNDQLTSGKLTIKNSTIAYNEALGIDGAGGGIYASTDCEVENTHIEHNYSARYGGGFWSSGNTTVKNSFIRYNRTMSSETEVNDAGGGVVNAGRGGGFHFSSTGKVFILDNTIVEYNAAMYYGGGGQLSGGAILYQRNGTKVNNNTAVLKGAGGLHLTGSVTYYLEDGEISYNTSGGVGGAIHSSYTCELHLNGGEIVGNTVYGRGGGVHINTGGDVILNGTNIRNNKAYDGVVLSFSTVTKNSDGTYFWSTPTSWNNKSYPGYGGGVLINSGTCTMESGELSGNHAETYGGGIALVMLESTVNYAADVRVVKFTLNEGNIESNTTNGNGGGIYLMKNTMPEQSQDVKDKLQPGVLEGIPQIVLNGGIIQGNRAKGNGGGAYQEQNTEFVIDRNVTVSSNQAGYNGGFGSGGAVYIASGGKSSILNGTFLLSNNVANNGNGGGMYCAGDFSVAKNAKAEIVYNEAVNGGGVCIENGSVTLASAESTIGNNTASNMGGGLYVVNGTDAEQDAVFQGGIFKNNSANSGGAVSAVGKINLTLAATMEGNTARNGNGGGIYMAEGVNMTFGDGLIRANSALQASSNTNEYETALRKDDSNVAGVGGGIFMGARTSLSFNSKEMGIYNNAATNAGADICANGDVTTLNLPNISTMNLKGFDVPGNALYWVEDHFTEESYEGSNGTMTGIRYEDALKDPAIEIVNYIVKFGGETSKSITEYICLDLGYDLVFVTLTVSGLKNEYEDTAITMSYPKKDADGNPTSESVQYRKVLIMGNGSRIVGLPSGDWKFVATGWNFEYNDPNFVPGHTNGYINIERNKNDKIQIEFKPKAQTGNIIYENIKFHEDRKVNRLKL